jgi:nitroreductase
MEFYDVLRTRRSIRSFKPDPVDEAVLERVLEAARIAPSGSNRQPWKFIVIKSRETRERLVPACQNQKLLAEAPVVIAALSLPIASNRGMYMGKFSVLLDVSIAFDHLLLAARREGLGTCWIGAFDNGEVKNILGVPEEVQVVALTPLGYPKDPEAFQPVKERKAMKEIVLQEKWPG